MKNRSHFVFVFCFIVGVSLTWSAAIYSDSYSYDSNGRLAGVTYDDGTSISYTYDSVGNLLQQLVTIPDLISPTTTASPSGGNYTSIQSVILSCDDGAGTGCANIHFTTDGSEPTTSSSVYSTALSISTDTTLKFFSVDNAANSETIQTESYVIQIAAGNNPPESFALVFPADVAIDLPASIPLIWKITTDPDGDSVSYQVIFCDNQAFINCSSQTVTFNSQNMILYASIAGPFTGLFILGLVFTGSPKTRIGKQLAFIAVIVFMSGLVACGGGGGGGSDPDDSILPTAGADEKQLDISGLTAATTYYWKVTADDGKGGLTDSETRSFITQ